MDAHIGTATTLKRVSRECEEAYTIISDTKKMSSRDVLPMTTSSRRAGIEKTPEEGLHGKAETKNTEEKEDAMLRVLESMSKKIEIEELDELLKKASLQHQYQTSGDRNFEHLPWEL